MIIDLTDAEARRLRVLLTTLISLRTRRIELANLDEDAQVRAVIVTVCEADIADAAALREKVIV